LKNLLLIVLLIITSAVLAQTPAKSKIPATPANNKKYNTGSVQSTPSYTAMHETCVNKNLSLVFYVVLDSNGTVGSATTQTITAMVNKLNEWFGKICVKFMNCSTVFIPNFTYNLWWNDSTEFLVTSHWYTEKTLNIYLVDSVKTSGIYEIGDTYYPITANLPPPANAIDRHRDFIVLEKDMLPQNNWAAPLHLFGHYFGLCHTSDEFVVNGMPTGPSLELADGSNCQTHGDRFCDTEADPGDQAITTDANGNFYIHPLDNMMSVYSTRCRFTIEQMNFMGNVIMTSRFYLH
jgi:hypothetical protein